MKGDMWFNQDYLETRWCFLGETPLYVSQMPQKIILQDFQPGPVDDKEFAIPNYCECPKDVNGYHKKF